MLALAQNSIFSIDYHMLISCWQLYLHTLHFTILMNLKDGKILSELLTMSINFLKLCLTIKVKALYQILLLQNFRMTQDSLALNQFIKKKNCIRKFNQRILKLKLSKYLNRLKQDNKFQLLIKKRKNYRFYY